MPGITVRQELRDGTLVRVPLRELAVPRRTLMIYREQGYVSDTARELIKIVRAFNWDQGFSDKPADRAAESPRSNRAELRKRIRRFRCAGQGSGSGSAVGFDGSAPAGRRQDDDGGVVGGALATW